MEWHFLRLVLALLPEGVLAVVGHNFVLETGLKGEEKGWSSNPLAGGVVSLPLFDADGLGHVVANWEGSGGEKVEQLGGFSRNLELHFLSVEVTLTCDDRESLVSTRTPKAQRIPRSALQKDGVKRSHLGAGISLDNVPSRVVKIIPHRKVVLFFLKTVQYNMTKLMISQKTK